VSNEETVRPERGDHPTQRFRVLGDLFQALDRGHGVVHPGAEILRQVGVDELDVGELRAGSAAAATLEQIVTQIRADDGPVWMTTRNGLRERAVAAARVENVEGATGRELLERFGDELAAQPPRRCERH
jgi:hypothetical protein